MKSATSSLSLGRGSLSLSVALNDGFPPHSRHQTCTVAVPKADGHSGRNLPRGLMARRLTPFQPARRQLRINVGQQPVEPRLVVALGAGDEHILGV